MGEGLEAARAELAHAKAVFEQEFASATPEQQVRMLGEYPVMFAELEADIARREADEITKASKPIPRDMSDKELLTHLVQDARDHGHGHHGAPKEQPADHQTPERRASESRKRLQG